MSCLEDGAGASPPPPPTPFPPPVPLPLAGDPGVESGKEEDLDSQEEEDLDRAAKLVEILDGPHPDLEAVWKLTKMPGSKKGKAQPPGDSGESPGGERVCGGSFGRVAELPNVKTHQSMHALMCSLRLLLLIVFSTPLLINTPEYACPRGSRNRNTRSRRV
jgi:hypothetical protein